MDEKFTREKKKSPIDNGDSEKEVRKTSYAGKLKNEESRRAAMRKKLRSGKADNSEKLSDKVANDKAKNQGRKISYANAAMIAEVRKQAVSQNKDDNAGVNAMDVGARFAEGALYSKKAKGRDHTNNGYGKKLHGKRDDKGDNKITPKQAQKNLMKKEIQMQAHKAQAKKVANEAGSITKAFVDKAEDMVGKIGETVVEAVQRHPLVWLLIGGFLLLIVGIANGIATLSVMGGGISGITLETSFTAEDKDIIEVDNDYKAYENALRAKIKNIEKDYPGYDEYKYSFSEIGHNPYELAALLTVLYEDYTPDEVQGMLQKIYDMQYTLITKDVIEKRTRKVTKWHWVTKYKTEVINGVTVMVPYKVYESYEEEEEYEYRILEVTLINHSIDYVARNLGLTEDQLQRYRLLVETRGNKPDLFKDDPNPNPNPNPGDPGGYKVPSEYLTDEEFGRMLKEAEKYLGYPYVWGGSSPATSFDCSGFVSYVINNCGNGWNVGRLTCDGLLNCCTVVPPEQAKPGDLIFFEKTYDVDGTSHVGIYVGDGMMIHCGDPIQYTSINSSYWQSHFYAFGRLKH